DTYYICNPKCPSYGENCQSSCVGFEQRICQYHQVSSKNCPPQPPSGMLRDVHPNPDNVRRGRGGGTAVLGDRLHVSKRFSWLEVGSIKIAMSPAAHQHPAESMRCITPAVGQQCCYS